MLQVESMETVKCRGLCSCLLKYFAYCVILTIMVVSHTSDLIRNY